MIRRDYTYSFLLDSLPNTKLQIMSEKEDDLRFVPKTKEPVDTHGIEIGYRLRKETVIYNHFNFVVKYNYLNKKQQELPESERKYVIVGFEVKPESKAHDTSKLENMC